MHLSPKYFFFAKTQLCTCSKGIVRFFSSFSFYQILTFYKLQNLQKVKHHLFHDRIRREVGLFLIWRHKVLCMHVYKELIRSNQFMTSNQEQTHAPSGSVVKEKMLSFIGYKKSRFGKKKKKGKRSRCVSNRCKYLFKRKKCLGSGAL